jgi:poly-gamma-glutamate synthesis protein (capsule biosynthesis protein)
VEDQALTIARDTLASHDMIAELSTAELADVQVTTNPADSDDALPLNYWVPVVQLPVSVNELTFDELEGAVAGTLDSWSSIDGRDVSLRVVVPSERPPPLDQWFPEVTPDVDALPLDQIPGALFTDPGVLVLMPLDAVNAGMRSLGIDGANAVFGTGDLAAYPLVERGWVEVEHSGNDEFDDALDEVGRALEEQLPMQAPDPIIMRATGDIIPARCALAKIEAYGDHTHPYLELGPWLREGDITVGSLDSSMADISPPWPCEETFNLAAPSAAIEGLEFSGFDLMTNATNHALDCGQVGSCGSDAMLATNENLRAAGIQVVGSGADLAEARQPVVLAIDGVRFAFLGYDDIQTLYHAEPGLAGTAPLDEAYVQEDVAAAAQVADVVIVMPHWGIEYQAEPTERQRTIAAAAVNAGADVVLGNHAHWVAAAEVLGDAFVAYGLGNFVFDQDWSLETQQGVVMELAFHPDGQGGAPLRGIRYLPIHIWDEHQPRFADEPEASQIMDRIWDASAALD